MDETTKVGSKTAQCGEGLPALEVVEEWRLYPLLPLVPEVDREKDHSVAPSVHHLVD